VDNEDSGTEFVVKKPDRRISTLRPSFAYGDFKPCPFCGNYQIEIRVNSDEKYYAICEKGDSCGVRKPGCRTIDDALRSWNRRADL